MKKLKLFGLLLIIVSCFLICNNVVKGEEVAEDMPGVYFRSDIAEVNGRVYVDLDVKDKSKLKRVYLYFFSKTDSEENTKMFDTELQDIYSDNPYFVVSNDMKVGHTYVMHSVYLDDIYVAGKNKVNKQFKTDGKNVITIKKQDKLKNMELVGNSTVKSDGKLTIKLETNANCDYISVGTRNKYIPTIGSIVYLNKISDNTYELNLSKGSDKLTDGDYYISDVFVFEGTTSTHYSSYSTGSDVLYLNYNVEFTIQDNEPVNEVKEDLLNAITIKSTNAKLNEKVNAYLDTNKDLTSATLIFSNEKESMTVNLKNLNSSDTYFVVPFTTSAGIYNLDYAILKDVDGNEYQYRKGEDYYTIKHFDFNSSLTITNEIANGNLLNIDNSKMTAEVLNKLKELESNIVIEINANDNPIISKDLFETIKESNKTIIIKFKDLEWTFNGLDIKNPKQIDVSTNIYNVSEDNNISSRVEDGFVLDFADNDELPGKCLIKVYNSETISEIMNKNNANVYYYNEKTNKFEIVKLNAEYNTNGYYEFYIRHNSKYVITTNKIDDKYVSNTKAVANNNIDLKSILIMAVPTVIIVIMLIIIIKLIKKEKKMKNS